MYQNLCDVPERRCVRCDFYCVFRIGRGSRRCPILVNERIVVRVSYVTAAKSPRSGSIRTWGFDNIRSDLLRLCLRSHRFSSGTLADLLHGGCATFGTRSIGILLMRRTYLQRNDASNLRCRWQISVAFEKRECNHVFDDRKKSCRVSKLIISRHIETL